MAMFSSREPFNDDPEPWLYELSNIGPARKSSSDIHTWFRPRPKFDRPQNNPTNRALLAYRRGPQDPYEFLFELESRWATQFTHSERDHARDVVDRLIALSYFQ